MTVFSSAACSAELRGENRLKLCLDILSRLRVLNVHLFRVFVIIIALTFNDRDAFFFLYSGQKFTKHPISLL